MLSATYMNRGEDYGVRGLVPTIYQVDFWTHLTDRLPDTPPEKVGYKKDAYLLAGAADIDEVMAWVSHQAQGRLAVVYAVLDDDRGRRLFHLSGTDPTWSR